MRIVFMGTPDFAMPALEALYKKHEIVCVYTQAPKEAGRGMEIKKSPVHLFASAHGIEVRTPKTLRNEEEQAKFKEIKADLTIVAAYGLILPQPILDAFPKGCYNIHGSLLPRWRGAAPIQRAIEFGDFKTGITIMKVVQALDAGDMLLKGEIEIDAETTGGILHDKMAILGAKLILKYLDNMDNIKGEAQDETQVSYAQKIDKAECLLDFNLPAEVLERKIRAFNPYPATYFEHKGERFKVYKANLASIDGFIKAGEIRVENNRLFIGCAQSVLEILEIQRSGKKAGTVKELLNGYKFNLN